MRLFILAFSAVLFASCGKVEYKPVVDKYFYTTSSIDDTTMVYRVDTIGPTYLYGTEEQDSTELYWLLADSDLELVSIDSVKHKLL